MSITMFQTCDPIKYVKIIDITSKINRLFCENTQINYNYFIGYKRGYYPWHAAFNRITYFNELLRSGYDGWCLYLDTDAFVVDLNFNIREYLLNKIKNSVVICSVNSDKVPRWDVNNGVMFLNFSHPHTKTLVKMYFQAFSEISNENLKNAPNFHDIIDDQQILQNILKENNFLTNDIFYEDPNLINSDNSVFIRQILRSVSSSFDDRLINIKNSVDKFMPKSRTDKEDSHKAWDSKENLFDIIHASYMGLLERPPEDGVLDFYGPNIDTAGVRNGLKDLLIALKNSGEFKSMLKVRNTAN